MSQFGGSTLGPNAQVSDSLLNLRRANERTTRNLQLLEERGSNDQARTRILDDRAEAKDQCRLILGMLQNPARGLDVQRFLSEFQAELAKFEDNSKRFKVIEQRRNEVMQETQQSRPAPAAAAAAAPAAPVANTGKKGKKGGKAGANTGASDMGMSRGGAAGAGGIDIGAMLGGPEPNEEDPMLGDLQMMDSQMEGLVAYEASELRRREELVHELEADVVRIHEWVIQFNQLVHEQGEQLEQIEDVLVKTKEKTTEAHVVLEEAEDYQKKARKKKCCLLSIFVIVAGVVAIGVWQTVK